MPYERNVYLNMKTLKEARKILFSSFLSAGHVESEIVSAPDAVGRVLSKHASARLSSPGFNAAAMDGIAVKAEFTYNANETKPKKLIIDKDAFYINTGNVMPENTDAVIMIEHVNVINSSCVEIETPAFPWQNVRKMGEDIVATELLFSQNHIITPYCVGALLSAGIFSVSVRKKPKVLVIPTGSELIDWQATPMENLKPGQVFETNSFVLEKLIEACGGICMRHEIMEDNIKRIKEVVLDAAKSDFNIILVIGGSSAGSEDYAKHVIADLGKVLVHGVTIMPGKPVIIGSLNDKPIFGIPGYQVSAIVAFEQFVGPLICRMLRQPDKVRATVQVKPAKKIASKLGIEEFLRVKLGAVGGRIIATPLPRGAGSITTLTEADGVIRIPGNLEGLKEDEPVTAELLRPLSLVNNTIIVVGSHDNTLDVLADQLKADHTDITLSSSHVGSMGGLMAIKKKVCHLAGSHLLDTESGIYNISYIKKYLPDTRVKLVNLVLRDQGLILFTGNPKKIKGITDLCRNDIIFINRQAGSGTRILLDYKLKQLDIDPGKICGYENDEFTHMSVAAAVLSGSVDVGLGIYAAAKALSLDFIPVVREQYDLIILQDYFESKNIQLLLNTINTRKFKKRVQSLGGYSTEKTGDIIKIL